MTALVRWTIHWAGLGEEGQFGVCTTTAGVTTEAQLVGAVAQIETEFSAGGWGDQFRSLLNANQGYDYVRAYLYPDATAPATAMAEHSISNGAATGARTGALQNALVADMLTGHSGASHRGKMYLPGSGIIMANDTQVSQAVLDGTVQALAGDTTHDSLLVRLGNAMSSAGGGEGYPVLYSPKLNQVFEITSVSIDSKMDTQRRRAANQQALRRKSGPVTATA